LAKAVLLPGFFYFSYKQKNEEKETSEMKQSTGTFVRMSGEKMEVLLEARCVTHCAQTVTGKLPQITRLLCKSLAERNVARFFIHNVRIGETVALVDKKNGYTCRIKMEAHTVRVLEIHENIYRQEESANIVYLVNTGLMRAVSGGKAAAA